MSNIVFDDEMARISRFAARHMSRSGIKLLLPLHFS
jgi:hypothetical protein